MAPRNRKLEDTNKSIDTDEKKKQLPKPFSGRFNPKLGKRPESTANKTMIPHAWWARIVMLVSVFLVAYISNLYKPRSTIMAKVTEDCSGKNKRYQNFLCVPAFKREIEALNKDCAPVKCGRAVIDGMFDEDTIHKLLGIAKKGLSLGGSLGGASILDMHSGALSMKESFIDIYKSKPNLYTKEDFEIYSKVRQVIHSAISSHFKISQESLFLTHPTFFSRITNKPAKTLHDEYWHVHNDKDTYPNFHYTSLLYLTDYDEDFKGGNFVFTDDKMNRTIEPKAGRVSMFTSGKENKHHVEPVISGTRYALTLGFTCDKSKSIQDPGQLH